MKASGIGSTHNDGQCGHFRVGVAKSLSQHFRNLLSAAQDRKLDNTSVLIVSQHSRRIQGASKFSISNKRICSNCTKAFSEQSARANHNTRAAMPNFQNLDTIYRKNARLKGTSRLRCASRLGCRVTQSEIYCPVRHHQQLRCSTLYHL